MSDWDYTKNLKKWFETQLIVQSSGPNGLYLKDRRIIQRDSIIDEGIFCVASNQMEYIVVDSHKYHQINKLYSKLKKIIKETNNVMRSVYSLVENKMEYDLEFVEKIEKKFATKKVALDIFIEHGKGVCRHMALLCGVLLEKCINDGFLFGQVSIDRNSIEEEGGHAWCRCTMENNEIFILDPAQHFFGRLDVNDKKTIIKGYHIWDYYRPEDIIC